MGSKHKLYLFSIALCLFATQVFAQGFTATRAALLFLQSAVADLPSTPSTNSVRIVTDGNSSSDCTIGGGSTRVLCHYNGSAWASLGDGGTSGAELTANKYTNDGYPGLDIVAGVPGAGSCDGSGHMVVDTTNEDLYFCSDGAGGNPRLSHTRSTAYTSVQGDSGSASPPAGGATFTIVGGTGLTTVAADGSPDTVTVNVDNHVKTIYFPAGALSADGTQCANPAEVTINSGPKMWTIICTDNDASTIYGQVEMPDSYALGTVTIKGLFIQTAADTNAMNSDIAMACRGSGDTINNTWGSEVALDIANMTGSNALNKATSGAITPNGTCGRSLFFRWQLDATGTTTAVATLHVVGFAMEYTVTGGGSD